MKNIFVIVLLAFFVSCAEKNEKKPTPPKDNRNYSTTGHIRDGGHSEGIKVRQLADELYVLVERNPNLFEGVPLFQLKQQISDTEIFIICPDPNEVSETTRRKCGEIVRDEAGSREAVQAAMINDGGKNIDVVYFLWAELSRVEKMSVLAHELFEMMKIESNEYRYSRKVKEALSLESSNAEPVVPAVACDQEIPLFIKGRRFHPDFDTSAARDIVSRSKLAFREKGYAVRFEAIVDDFGRSGILGEGPRERPSGLSIEVLLNGPFDESEVAIDVFFRSATDSPEGAVVFELPKTEFPYPRERVLSHVVRERLPDCSALNLE